MKIDGLPVYDATAPLLLHITRADATSGQKDPGKCAAAKAAKRTPGVIEARIYRTRSFLLVQNKAGEKSWRRYNTPNSIRNEIISFDRGARFEPDDYVLTEPRGVARLGKAHKRNSHGRPPHKVKHTPHIVKGIRELGPRGQEAERKARK